MPRVVYLNGAWRPEAEAMISVFDRGFLMADGVYEVTSVLAGKLLDFDAHMQRLARSLSQLGIGNPLSYQDYLEAHRKLLVLNNVTEGLVYLQVTRGNPGDRDFHFPPADTPQTVVMFTQDKPGLAQNPQAKTGLAVVSLPDLRWQRRDIKTVQLLYPSLAKMEAQAKGADDAWLVEDGMVTEGTSNNAYIIKDGCIITRPLSHEILHGITRAALLRFAQEARIEIQERSFSIAEAQAADEAFSTSASGFVLPVVQIDGVKLGNGAPGPIATRLREIYIEEALKTAI